MPKDDDHALLQRVADGDESALAALYDSWGERVHTLAFWILMDADEAEDVVEETFWQAWRMANQYDGRRGTVATWLTMIARSRALDRLRARQRRAAWAAAPASVLLERAAAGDAEVLDAEPERTERHTALASALGALPPEQREVLELAFFRGLSHSEIAEQTSQALGTVKTRIRLALQKLRQSLAFLEQEGQ